MADCYYMPVKTKVLRGITTYVALNAEGEKAVFADGRTEEEAAEILRSCARAYLAAIAEEGWDPLKEVYFGQPPEGCLLLTEEDWPGFARVAVTEFRILWETCEELARAARHHLADPASPACRDRLSTATADALAVLYQAPRPRRAITVEELVASGLTVKVGITEEEAAIPWYNRHPSLDEAERTLTHDWTVHGSAMSTPVNITPARTSTSEEETLDILSDQAFSQSLEKSFRQVKEGNTRSSVEVRQRLGIPTKKMKLRKGKR